MDRGSKVAAESSESVGILDNLGSRNRWFFQKRNLNFWNQLSLASLKSNANGAVRFLKTFKICFFFKKKMGFSRDYLELLLNG